MDTHPQHRLTSLTATRLQSTENPAYRYRRAGTFSVTRRANDRKNCRVWSAARDFVVRVITGADVFCDPPAIRDKYNRLFTRCYANQRDIARELVEAGWAVTPIDWPSEYRDSEYRAKSYGRGLWRLKFNHPQQHRRHVSQQ